MQGIAGKKLRAVMLSLTVCAKFIFPYLFLEIPDITSYDAMAYATALPIKSNRHYL